MGTVGEVLLLGVESLRREGGIERTRASQQDAFERALRLEEHERAKGSKTHNLPILPSSLSTVHLPHKLLQSSLLPIDLLPLLPEMLDVRLGRREDRRLAVLLLDGLDSVDETGEGVGLVGERVEGSIGVAEREREKRERPKVNKSVPERSLKWRGRETRLTRELSKPEQHPSARDKPRSPTLVPSLHFRTRNSRSNRATSPSGV